MRFQFLLQQGWLPDSRVFFYTTGRAADSAGRRRREGDQAMEDGNPGAREVNIVSGKIRVGLSPLQDLNVGREGPRGTAKGFGVWAVVLRLLTQHGRRSRRAASQRATPAAAGAVGRKALKGGAAGVDGTTDEKHKWFCRERQNHNRCRWPPPTLNRFRRRAQ